MASRGHNVLKYYDNWKCILLNENVWIFIDISPFFFWGSSQHQHTSTLVEAKVWHLLDKKPLPEPMVTKTPDHTQRSVNRVHNFLWCSVCDDALWYLCYNNTMNLCKKKYRKFSNISGTKSQTQMFLVSTCSCVCAIYCLKFEWLLCWNVDNCPW